MFNEMEFTCVCSSAYVPIYLYEEIVSAWLSVLTVESRQQKVVIWQLFVPLANAHAKAKEQNNCLLAQARS